MNGPGRSALRGRRRLLYAHGRRVGHRADAELRRAEAEQLERFEGLAGDFAERYAALRRHADATACTELWLRYERELEGVLLPRPPRGFLGLGVLLETMSLVAGGRLLREELGYLAAHRSAAELSRFLRESPVGEPALRAAAHSTSHTAVHHLYHLERHREATGWDWRTVERVVEWGAGYGALARILMLGARRPPALTLIDVPLLSALQWLYLSSVLGCERVHVIEDVASAPEAGVAILPVGAALAALAALPGERAAPVRPVAAGAVARAGNERPPEPDLFVSTWGLSESSAGAQRSVAGSRFFGAGRLLVAFQYRGRLLPDAAAAGALAVDAGAVIHPLPRGRSGAYAFR